MAYIISKTLEVTPITTPTKTVGDVARAVKEANGVGSIRTFDNGQIQILIDCPEISGDFVRYPHGDTWFNDMGTHGLVTVIGPRIELLNSLAKQARS